MKKNFVHLISSDKDSTINTLDFDNYPEIKELHHTKIKQTITKITASPKTKALMQLQDKNILKLGFGALKMNNPTQPLYLINIYDQNTLRGIYIDLSKIVDPVYYQTAIENIRIIETQQDVITQNESMLSQTSTIQIEMAKESIIEKYKDLIENIDYFVLCDLYYYGYLKFLTKLTVKQNKQKVFFAVNEIYQELFQKIIKSYTSIQLEKKDSILIQTLIDYLMISQYSDSPVQQTMNAVRKSLEESQPEVLEVFNKIQPQKFHKVEEITYLLAEAKIMNMTPSAFNIQLSNQFGDKFFDFNQQFDSLVAYLISLGYKSELFYSKAINGTNHNIQRLEDLVLNAKGSILLKAY